ncbi:MAG: DUF4870 domain-containing protein [Bacteroidota bacterium]|nr:DUF4870 domain-containing protein [Bacteroidota bacterium]
MTEHPSFMYTPNEYEAEKASNSYLMSVIAVMIGLPLPVINLIATVIFFLANKRATHFVRWHCMQALLSQGFTFPINVAGVYWTLSILFGANIISNSYIAYIITIIVFNIAEFIATVYAAVQTRKGNHVEWWLFGPLTHLMIKS